MSNVEVLYTIYIVWNVITFALMAIDKGKAENKEYRISERFFFISSFLFGALGVFLGMQIFRHKTQHLSFKILIPIALTLNIFSLIKINLFF